MISFDIIMYSIAIHLGKNPKNGGMPPILNIMINILILSITGIYLIFSWLIYIILYFFIHKLNIIIITLYKIMYIIHSFLYIRIHDIIQPMWFMDEYDMIFRIDVWFSPKMAPDRVDKAINDILIILFWILNDTQYIGAIFCHVINIIHMSQFILFIISGNHIWNGGIPNFIIIDNIIIIFISVFLYKLFHPYILTKIMIIKIMDAILCVKKYIILLCDKSLFLDLYINGMNDIMLISIPIQMVIQFLDLNTINVLMIVIDKNNVFDDVLLIKKKNLYSILRVWT